MTEELKQKIEQEANWLSTDGHGVVNEITKNNFLVGVNSGYRIKEKELEAANNRIKELEGLLSLTESQRIELANTEIRFKARIDEFENQKNEFDF